MKLDPRTQALVDALLKSKGKKSAFSPSQQETIQRVKTRNIAEIVPQINYSNPNPYAIKTGKKYIA